MRMPTPYDLSSNEEFQDIKQIGDATVAAVEDDGAATYWRVLYPSAAAQQRMSNRDVLRALAERGDDHDAPRTIEHFAYFKTAAGRQAFISAVEKRGFAVRDIDPERRGEFPLVFRREDKPAAIDSITDGLVPLIDENQGVYDGWGCEVVK
ncbi:hypothetical protein CHELA1G11_21045 [Hyphomicrobiales bacterium]|nr:hypothetical protein CHELA1G11_21045 [Hyphomicrobiales bacterium]CAH1693065.1 hypothetical protein CHELA1G2_21353 [Hyphomicrobiales bacterium]